MKRTVLHKPPQTPAPITIHGDNDIPTMLRKVIDSVFDGSIRKCAAALGFDHAYFVRCLQRRHPTSNKVVERLRELEQRLPSERAKRHLALHEQVARLELIPLIVSTLPDPDERPYERQPGPKGGVVKRTQALAARARAERKRPKPPRKGDPLSMLIDNDE